MTTPENITELLGRGMRSASDVAQTRIGRNVSLVVASEPAATALLRFDVQFDGGAILSWFVSNEDATGFSDVLIGGPGDRGAVLTEMHLDALSGVFSDMLEAAVAGINSALASPVTAGGVDMGMESELPALDAGGVRTSFALDVDGFGPLTLAVQANQALVTTLNAAGIQVESLGSTSATPAETAATAPDAPQAASAAPAATHDAGLMDNVVQLPTAPADTGQRADLRMLLNVPLQVTVELGRAQRTVRDLLELNVGSILELDKLAGDPMDIMVNGRVLARGEVVVIDEEFGIRITEIANPEVRARGLGG